MNTLQSNVEIAERPKVAVCNNMVTPYTNRLFNDVARDGRLSLVVVSCTKREKNRSWEDNYEKQYDHRVLRGLELHLSANRIIHLNLDLWPCLNSIKPSVVAINGIYPSMLIAALWAFVHRAHLVFLTDGWSLTMPQSIYHRILRPFIVKRCGSIICSSEKGRDFFIDAGTSAPRIFVAPIVPSWDAPTDVPAIEGRPYHVLWCGRLSEDKNIEFFVQLAIILQSRVRDLKIRIVGDGPLRETVLRDLSLANVNFDYTQYVAPDEIAPIFSSARLLVLPSKLEAWGLVCNEAMQCGTPCLVSPTTGVANELVKDLRTGYVLELNPSRWADTIVDLLQSPSTWQSMSQEARQASSKLNSARAAESYAEGLLFSTKAGASS